MDYNFMGLNSYQVNAIRSQASLLKHQQDVKSYISSILNLLFSEIDKIPEVKGAGVCYVNGNGEITEFRTAEPRSNKQPIYIVLREPPESLTQSHFASYLKQAQEKPKESRLAQELSDLFFSCTPVILGWFVVGASAAAMPLTGGYLGWLLWRPIRQLYQALSYVRIALPEREQQQWRKMMHLSIWITKIGIMVQKIL